MRFEGSAHQTPEGEGSSEVTGPSDRPDKMAEVAGLAAAIADRILEQHEAGTLIPPEQFRMFVRAAQMLLDNCVSWPSSVEHLVTEVARRVQETAPASADKEAGTKGNDVVVHLTQALDAAKRRRELALDDPS